jgi:hypothetical protein
MKYLRSIVHETDWQGDHVRAEMEPLDRESFFALADSRKEQAADAEAGQLAVYAMGVRLLDKHLLRLSGLVDAAGTPIEKETVLTKVFFMTLVNELFAALMRGSTLGEVKSGGSAVRSSAGTEEPRSTAST